MRVEKKEDKWDAVEIQFCLTTWHLFTIIYVLVSDSPVNFSVHGVLPVYSIDLLIKATVHTQTCSSEMDKAWLCDPSLPTGPIALPEQKNPPSRPPCLKVLTIVPWWC